MKFSKLNIDTYLNIKEILNKLKKNKVWENFSDNDLFYLKIDNREVLISFGGIEEFDKSKISFFFGNEGLNFAHTILTSDVEDLVEQPNISIVEVILAKKKFIDEDHIIYFYKNGIKIKQKDNILVSTKNYGYARRIVNNKEAREILKVLEYFNSIMEQELPSLKKNIEINGSNNIYIYPKRKKYFISDEPLPYLERKYENVVYKEEEIKEFSNCQMTDVDAYLNNMVINIPVKVKESNVNVLPMLFMYSSNQENYLDLEVLISTPNDYRSYLISILKENFTTNGIPRKLYINDKIIYSLLYELLNQIGVEVIYELINQEIYETFESIRSIMDNIINRSIDLSSKHQIIIIRGIVMMVKKMILEGHGFIEDILEQDSLLEYFYSDIFMDREEIDALDEISYDEDNNEYSDDYIVKVEDLVS